MNWKRLLLNMLGAALVGIGGLFSSAAAGGTVSGKAIGAAAGAAAITNLIGLFQEQPHRDDEL